MLDQSRRGESKDNEAEFGGGVGREKKKLAFIPLSTDSDELQGFRSKKRRGKGMEGPASASVNWPRLFHAVVGL